MATANNGCSKFSDLWDKRYMDLMVDVCYRVLKAASMGSKDIQAAWYGNWGPGFTGSHTANAVKIEPAPSGARRTFLW